MIDTITQSLITALVSMGWLMIMFIPLERAFPADRDQPVVRHGLLTDVLFFFGQYVVFGALAYSILSVCLLPLQQWGTLQGLQSRFLGLPTWAQVIIVLMFGDFMAYWGHRLQHNNALLWRFHSVHHTSEHVDWLAAHREHPLDGLYTQSMVNLPAIVLGFDLGAAMGVMAFRSLWAIFIHANVRVPLGPFKYLVGSPNLHRWHHAKDQHVGNYANLGPWLDLIFGTYYLPDEGPTSLGLEEPTPQDYPGLLLHPFKKTGQPDK